jgi:hypothetical protein
MDTRSKIDITDFGDLTIIPIIDPNDFSLNLMINGKLAIKMQLEQLERFVKEVILLRKLC